MLFFLCRCYQVTQPGQWWVNSHQGALLWAVRHTNPSTVSSILEASSFYWFILTHSEPRPPNLFIPERKKKKKKKIIIKLASQISLYSLQISKTWYLCRQNKIWKFRHPFQSKRLPICSQDIGNIANLRICSLFLPKIIPMSHHNI